MRAVLFIILLTLVTLPAHATSQFNSGWKWWTYDTPHFQVIFHDGLQKQAFHLATYAETVHREVTTELGHVPGTKTTIILVDSGDVIKAYSNAIYEKLVISPTQGDAEVLGTKHADWIRFILTHEYTHSVHLDMAFGFWNVTRLLYGRLAVPNIFMPIWFLEGIAVHNETKFTEGGRLRDPLFNAVSSTAVRESKVPSLSQISTTMMTKWPDGNIQYYFGAPLSTETDRRRGGGTLGLISRQHATFVHIFDIQSQSFKIQPNFGQTYYEVMGSSEAQVYHDWGLKVATHEAILKTDRAADPIGTSPEAWTRNGIIKANLKWHPDGQHLMYSGTDFEEPSGITIVSATGEAWPLTRYTSIYSGFSITPDGKTLLYSQAKRHEDTRVFIDSYVMDMATNDKKRLTENARLRDPEWIVPGKSYLAVRNNAGFEEIVRVDVASIEAEKPATTITPVLTYDIPVKIMRPVVSPNQTTAAASISYRGTTDITLIPLNGGPVRSIWRDKSADWHPAWSPDGKWIYFSSDRGGKFNIYAYEPASQKLYQVTDAAGAAIVPAISPDGKRLAYINYTATGFDVAVAPINRAAWKATALPASDPLPAAPTLSVTAPAEAINLRPYSPLPTMRPRIWAPVWGVAFDEQGPQYGLLTQTSDMLEQHEIFLTGVYGVGSNRFSTIARYVNHQFWPTLTIQYADVTQTHQYPNRAIPSTYFERAHRVGVSASFPWTVDLFKGNFTVPTTLSVGMTWEDTQPVSLPAFGFVGATPLQARSLNRANVSWGYSDVRSFGFAVSPEEGRAWNLSYEVVSQALGASINSQSITAEYKNFHELPWRHHVLALRLVGGYERGDALTERNFQLGGFIPYALSLEGSRFLPLRGFTPGTIFGNKMILTSLEYRFPIWYVEGDAPFVPNFTKWFHGAFFVDAGEAWSNSFNNLKVGVGGEFRWLSAVFHQIPLDAHFGLAFPVDGSGSYFWYTRLGNLF